MVMASKATRKLIRRQLDERFKAARLYIPDVPKAGWIRAIRTALNMSVSDLGLRLGTSGQAAWVLERAEVDGGITLKKLKEAAEALGCEVRYVLIPHSSLEQTAKEQARRAAKDRIARVSHTMALESQGVSKEFEDNQLDELASELLDSSAIWKVLP